MLLERDVGSVAAKMSLGEQVDYGAIPLRSSAVGLLRSWTICAHRDRDVTAHIALQPSSQPRVVFPEMLVDLILRRIDEKDTDRSHWFETALVKDLIPSDRVAVVRRHQGIEVRRHLTIDLVDPGLEAWVGSGVELKV